MKLHKGKKRYKKGERIIVGVVFSGKSKDILVRLEAFRKSNMNIARGIVMREAVKEFLQRRGA